MSRQRETLRRETLRRDSLRPWGLVAVALLGATLGLVVVFLLAIRSTPEGRAVLEVIAPAVGVQTQQVPRRVRRARAASRQPHGRTELTVAVVGPAGAPVPGAIVAVRPCTPSGQTDAPWRQAVSDALGEAVLDASGCTDLRVEAEGFTTRGPAGVAAAGETQRVTVLLAALCPGAVEVTEAGKPASGELSLNPGGRAELDDAGRAWFGDRRCGTTDVFVKLPKSVAPARRHFWLQAVEVVGDETLLLDLDLFEPVARAQPRDVSVTLICDDCPDQVRSSGRKACRGEGTQWTCTCLDRVQCGIEAWWQEVLFDWRFIKEDVAVVLPDQDEITVVLEGFGVDVLGRWLGPQPCAVSAFNPETMVELRGECLPDGTLWLSGLRPGTWELQVGWAPDGSGSGHELAGATRRIQVDGEEIDLGGLGPG